MLSSPVTTGTYFLTEAPTAGAAVAPVWTNAATYLANPPAIGGTTPNTGAFSSLASTSSNSATGSVLGANYTGTVSAIPSALLCPNIATATFCGMGFGVAASSGNEGVFLWNRTGTGVGAGNGYLSISTFLATAPVQIGGSYVTTSTSLAVDNAGANGGYSCGSGVALCVGSTSNSAAPFTVSAAGATTTTQVIGGGSAPTMVAGAAAGSSPACTGITGANMAGVITCTTGSATVASTTLATITFNGTLGTAPQGCKVMPRNAATAAAVTTVYTTAPSTTAWTIAIGGTALSASTAYSWSYDCL